MQAPVVLETRSVFRGRVLHLVTERVMLPHGFESTVEVIRHPGASAMVPYFEDGRVAMVRQYRHAVGRWLLEVPAGTLSPGEDPVGCAGREVAEEAGFSADRFESLGAIYTAPGFTDERISLWLARGLRPVERNLDEDEVMEVEILPLEEAVRRARSGEIEDAKSVCALLRAAERVSGV